MIKDLRKKIKEYSFLIENYKEELEKLEGSLLEDKSDIFLLQRMLLRNAVVDFELAIASINKTIKDYANKQIIDSVELDDEYIQN